MKIILVIILIALLIILLNEAGCFGSLSPATPASLSITGPPQIPRGGQQTFTITATMSDSATSPRLVSVRIDEDDRWDDLLAYVDITIPRNASQGSATFVLTCREDDVLTGSAGKSDQENEYKIHAEFSRSLLPNITSANHTLRCVGGTNH
jgi:hypothetical protein